jgi:UDP-glucose 4-epimerase
VKRFVHFSTSEIFGPNALWVTEENSPAMGPSSERRWVYATSKLAGEHFSLRYGEQHGFGTTVIRPFNVYGPRQTGEGAISNFCAAAVGGKGIKIYGDGSPLRAWCYVSDFVDAVIAVLQNDRAIGQSFNIGNPTEVETTLGLARRVQRIVPEVAIEFEHVERAEVRARVPDIKKARELLGFNPKIDLDEGLKRTLSWFRERRSV